MIATAIHTVVSMGDSKHLNKTAIYDTNGAFVTEKTSVVEGNLYSAIWGHLNAVADELQTRSITQVDLSTNLPAVYHALYNTRYGTIQEPNAQNVINYFGSKGVTLKSIYFTNQYNR